MVDALRVRDDDSQSKTWRLWSGISRRRKWELLSLKEPHRHSPPQLFLKTKLQAMRIVHGTEPPQNATVLCSNIYMLGPVRDTTRIPQLLYAPAQLSHVSTLKLAQEPTSVFVQVAAR